MKTAATGRNAPANLPCAPEAIDAFLSQPADTVLRCLAHQRGPFLALGAGGKMGLHLCAMLRTALRSLGRTDPVIAVSRFTSLRDREDFHAFGVETIAGDLHDEAFLRTLPDAPSVFFLAGVKFGTATSPELLQQMNVEMPRKVARRFATSRLVAFSTGCVYPFVTPASGGATEATPLAPVGDYAASCAGRERAFLETPGCHATLVRLNYSVEFRYGLLLDIALKVARSEPVDLRMGYCNVIWQSDAIAHAIQCLDLSACPARPLNLTGPEILSVRALAESFGRLLERPVNFQGEPAATAWLNNASLSHRLFGRPTVSTEQMIHWVASWVRADHVTWGKPTGFENREGKF
ncbi:MAG: NAD-dependent epimerase/dehydratase family protein [Opitutae bacterium]|jgi:nucleoside-diphosphate-sugar epimerase|nr:NAD-dependent epimerase/dehydratase family protein [Opitutae bacterium]